MWLKILTVLMVGCVALNAAETSDQKVPGENYLYKIVTVQQWKDSVQAEAVQPGPLDTDFMHLSEKGQVNKTLKKYWPTEKSVYVLTLDPSLFEDGWLKMEKNPGGDVAYPHYYGGSIPVGAVIEVRLMHPGETF